MEKPEKARARSAKWRKENPEKHRAYSRKWYKTHTERQRAKALRRLYKVSLADYDQMLKDQGGKCKGCHKAPTGRHLAVDHDHKTGRVRGLLCIRCNTKLAVVEDVEFMAWALGYIAS